MSASAAPAPSDRSDFRTILLAGTKVGVLTAAAVVLYLLVSKLVPSVGSVRQGVQALVVLAAGTAASFLPARETAARRTEGIAGAAAAGLWGSVVFMAFDVVLLRPFKAYPWTWDAIGGGSTWWYLPIWWMLGTFLAWMGAILTAGQASRGEPSLVRMAAPVLIGALVLAALARFGALHAAIPVAAGAGFTIALAVLAVAELARKA